MTIRITELELAIHNTLRCDKLYNVINSMLDIHIEPDIDNNCSGFSHK